MKTLLIAPVLALAACISPGPGLVPVGVDGPVARTVERVIGRVEVYMAAENPPFVLDAAASAQVAAAAGIARVALSGESASGAMLFVTMKPIMDLHDALVIADQNLDQLETDIYLEDTARLRSLFDSVSIHN